MRSDRDVVSVMERVVLSVCCKEFVCAQAYSMRGNQYDPTRRTTLSAFHGNDTDDESGNRCITYT